ncbi:MAG TPA: cell division protein FtsB [Steroidobacteraceae bacterium]|nr:cell division protein FtsB [Steroidobacteraceae bacterium]
MKYLAAVLLAVILLLQYRLWVSPQGVRELNRLHTAVTAQASENAALSERNRELAAEVRDLKTGMSALEERARSELGMIGEGESFYQVVPRKPAAAGDPQTRTAAR